MSSSGYKLEVVSCKNGSLGNVNVYEVTDRQLKCSATWTLHDFQIDDDDLEDLYLESSPSSMELFLVFQFEDDRKIPIEDACWFQYDQKYQIEDIRGGLDPLIFLTVTLGTLEGQTKKVSIDSSEGFQGFECEMILTIPPQTLQTDRDFQMIFGDFYKF